MKNSIIFFANIFLFLVGAMTPTSAQTSSDWVADPAPNANEHAVQQAIAMLFQSFNAGDLDKVDACYSGQAAVIFTDGTANFENGGTIENLKQVYKMLDEQPKYKYWNLQVRMLGTDVALAV